MPSNSTRKRSALVGISMFSTCCGNVRRFDEMERDTEAPSPVDVWSARLSTDFFNLVWREKDFPWTDIGEIGFSFLPDFRYWC